MRRSLGSGPVADVIVVLGTFLVVGAVCGVLWWLAVDPAQFTKTGNGGTMGEVDLAKRFNADGWYSVIAIVAGFLSGVLLTWWRSRDFRLTTVLLVVGAAVAAAVMTAVGHAIGPDSPDTALQLARRGQTVPVELEVRAAASYLTWPIAVLAGALMVLWSSPGVPSTYGQRPADAEDLPPDRPERTGPQSL